MSDFKRSGVFTVALVGQPNVGKSVIMNLLTKAGAMVSNYQGTTVEITQGSMPGLAGDIRVVDTPGAYSLDSGTAEQRVTQRVLAENHIDLIVNVVNAQTLARSLSLTLQLMDLEIPMILALNQMDMAEEAGIGVNARLLEKKLRVPVIPMIATKGEGIMQLRARIIGAQSQNMPLPPPRVTDPPPYPERIQSARLLAAGVQKRARRPKTHRLRARFENSLDTPLTGLPLLGVVLWITFSAVVKFMGFVEYWLTVATAPLAMWFENLAAGQSGLIKALLLSVPDGILLPFSVVMPAMLAIYIAMSILEDSGILPRIAVAMDKTMSFFGLMGQSAIPLLLGFGCKAPAILGTRILPGRNQRFIVSALLAITVPCAASLGLITGVGVTFGAKLSVIYASMAAVFVILGLVLGQSSKGRRRDLLLEIPPLRLPVLSNILSKTFMRLHGFFSHVLPLLVITSIAVQTMLDLGLMSGLSGLSSFSLAWLGIRGEALMAVAVSVVQRYMGPMVLMSLPLGAREATIAGAMVSISMPCLPVSILIGKELGFGSLAKIFSMAIFLSLGIGVLLNFVLPGF